MYRKFQMWLTTGLVFVFTVFVLYSYTSQNQSIEKLQQQNKKILQDFEQAQQKDQADIFKLNENFSVIDASISPDNKKWARIKQIRKIIVDVIKQHGTNNLTIWEITEISKATIECSEENDVPVSLILAVITVESAFKINVVSKSNARGLMQLLPDTASEISVEINKRNFNLFKIKDNIQLGSYYLWKMINLFGDSNLGISAYNCGPTCVERVKSGEYAGYPLETVNYLKKVNEWKIKYNNLGVE